MFRSQSGNGGSGRGGSSGVPRFQTRFRKKPKPKLMIKPMTKSLPMIRMSQDLAQRRPGY
jgi:hypothetical protein